MDKYEYKICLEDIKALISDGAYTEAAGIADTIDWKRVKSVRTLCMISDLYKINRRYTDSRDVLMRAFGRDPENSQIVYALCILELKLDEYLRAVQLYNEFVRLAPRDPNRFILKYKVYEAQEVSLEERTAILEELKKRTFKERWVYELATLYDRRGLYARCAELCDELISGGKTKYVRQALELKKTHSPLTPDQQSIYNRMFAVNQPVYETGQGGSVQRPNRRRAEAPAQEAADTEEMTRMQEAAKESEPAEEYRVRPMDENMVNTVNLQAAVAEGFREIMQKEPSPEEKKARHEARREEVRREFRKDLVPGDAPQETSEQDRREFRKAQEEAAAARAMMREEAGKASNEPETAAEKTGADVTEQPTAAIPANAVEQIKMPVYGKEPERHRSAQDMYDDAHIMQEAGGQYSLLIDEHQAAKVSEKEEQKPVEGVYARKGIESWQEMRRKNDERHARENIQKVEDSTGVLLARFDAEADHGVLQDIEEKTAEEARSERFRRAMPEGGELSDGMTDNERLHVDLTRPEEERRENRDTLVMDSEAESATRVWRGEEITRIAAAVKPERADLPKEAPAAESERADLPKETPADKPERADLPKETPADKPERADLPKETPAAESRDRISDSSTVNKFEAEKSDSELSETQEIAELIRQEFENGIAPADEEEEPREELSESDRRRAAAKRNRQWSEKLASVRETAPMDEEAAKAEEAYEAERKKRSEIEKTEENDRYRDEDREEDDRYRDEDREEDDRYRDEDREEDDRYRDEDREEDDRYRDEDREEDDRYRDENREEDDDRYRDDEREEEDRTSDEEPPAEDKKEEPEGAAEEQIRAERERKKKEAARIHAMTTDQKRMFGPYLTEKNTRTMLLKTIDEISLASYTGNVIITGEPGAGMTELAMNLLKNIRLSDSNFSGKVAVTNGASVNRKDPESIIRKLDDGGLIIEKAAALTETTIEALHKALEKEDRGIVVVLTDGYKAMERLLRANPVLSKNFTCRVDIHPLSDDELVHLTVRYADRKGYTIDNMAVLALHSRIAAMQTIDHHVTADEARVIVDEAIAYAEKKSPANVMGSLFGKRKGDNGKKILNEKDFSHYEE